MESESGTSNTKISDSGYSNSCSNSNSQRSASSKSRLSRSNSSASSGYGGTSSKNNGSSNTSSGTNSKEKEHKKKKLKCGASAPMPTATVRSSDTGDTSAAGKKGSAMVQTPPSFEAETIEVEENADPLQAHEDKVKVPDSVATPAREPTTAEDITDWNGGAVSNRPPQDESDAVEMTNVCSDDSLDSFTKAECNDLEEGFCCVISMYDGVVLYTTPSLTNLLGFPKDMWLGRSFIDFVHPKDREIFSTQVTTGITIPLTDSAGKNTKNSFYVFLRKYKGLKTTGFGVVEKTVSYQAFQLTATFRHIEDAQESKHPSNIGGIFLIIVAVPVTSSYKVPNEKKALPKFNVHHTAASIVSYVDSDIVRNFGFLPQDILGRSVFDFYHPEDMPLLKEVYESALSKCQNGGAIHRSKPYRFAVQNGGFATVETDWSCFFNPWTRKLEIVIGMHNILKGPTNPDVFSPPKEKDKTITENTLKESEILREEILRLLNHERNRPADETKQEVTKRCKDLAKFIEKVMVEVAKPSIKAESPEDSSVNALERDFVVLGEVSPHNDYDRASSETPPSYYQLNYNENIHRFFESKPRTKASEESCQPDSEQERKSSSPAQEESLGSIGKCLSPVQNNTGSRSESGNLSSVSNVNMETVGTRGNGSSDSYSPPHLTEALLSKHNKDMEKIMRKRYREYRSTVREKDGKPHKSNKKAQMLVSTPDKNESPQCTVNHPHGVKRSGSNSWEGDHHKMTKHKHQTNANRLKGAGESSDNFSNLRNAAADIPREENYRIPELHDTNLWPPFSLTVTPAANSYTFSTNDCGKNGAYAGLFPIYLLPTATQREQPVGNVNDPTRPPVQVQYMPSMVYNCSSMFSAPPIFCPPVAMVPVPIQQPSRSMPPFEVNSAPPAPSSNTEHLNDKSGMSIHTGAFVQRPSSQATSVKAEPGSGLGSVASASCLNKTVDSKQSSKTLEMQDSYGTYDGSSHSSMYSSFLKTTDTGSDPNEDSSASENRNRANDNFYRKPAICPVRNRDPPWLETVSVTPDLIYRYQVATKDMEEILEADLNSLKGIHQPTLVNDQLDQLYVEMELQGLSARLTLEEGITSSSSSSSGDENATSRQKVRTPTRKRKLKRPSNLHVSSTPKLLPYSRRQYPHICKKEEAVIQLLDDDI